MKRLKEWLKHNKLFTLIIAGIIIMWIAYLIFMLLFIKISKFYEINHAGTFGDMFGALNTLFTGLAFGGVVISIIQQNKSLEQQKDELNLYKEELSKNTHHLGLQNRNQQTQKFETTFFNLINMIKMNISNLGKSNSQYTGVELIQEIVQVYVNKYYPNPIDMNELGLYINSILPEYRNIYDQIVFIIKFIETEIGTEHDKAFYGIILANQMSISEKTWLASLLKFEEKNNDDKDHTKYIQQLFEKYKLIIDAP